MLEAAIMRTVLYGDVFDYPMTIEEIHHFLIHDQMVSLDEIRHTLETSSYLRQHLTVTQGYVARIDRADLIPVRLERSQIAKTLWPPALWWGQRLASLPFVRMVGMTGALAVDNPSNPKDDLDYMLVTKEGRVWLARAFAILLVYVAKLRGVILCPNYVLAENVLDQPNRDLYIAHELAQIVPLYGFELYRRIRAINSWTSACMPNADDTFHRESEVKPGIFSNGVKQGLEFLLGGSIGDRLESWERNRKLKRFAPEMQTSTSAAQLDDTKVKGHFNDHGLRVLKAYEERLRRYDLVQENPLTAAAD